MGIDLIEFADCFTPDHALACLFAHMPDISIPAPLEVIAQEVGIQEIKYEDTEDFDGALLCDPYKQSGIIIVKQNTITTRQRFTIGHELGHFLIQTHIPDEDSFVCSNIMGENGGSLHPREIEANHFAANLIMPNNHFANDLKKMGEPDLVELFSLSTRYEVSLEALLRNFIDKTDFNCCAVFTKDNIVRYLYWTAGFPFLCVKKEIKLPKDSWAYNCNKPNGFVSEVEESEGLCWLDDNGQKKPQYVFEQTICQADGYKVTLIWFDEYIDDDEDVEWELPRFKK